MVNMVEAKLLCVNPWNQPVGSTTLANVRGEGARDIARVIIAIGMDYRGDLMLQVRSNEVGSNGVGSNEVDIYPGKLDALVSGYVNVTDVEENPENPGYATMERKTLEEAGLLPGAYKATFLRTLFIETDNERLWGEVYLLSEFNEDQVSIAPDEVAGIVKMSLMELKDSLRNRSEDWTPPVQISLIQSLMLITNQVLQITGRH
jgi:hypothetical protein